MLKNRRFRKATDEEKVLNTFDLGAVQYLADRCLDSFDGRVEETFHRFGCQPHHALRRPFDVGIVVATDGRFHGRALQAESETIPVNTTVQRLLHARQKMAPACVYNEEKNKGQVLCHVYVVTYVSENLG